MKNQLDPTNLWDRAKTYIGLKQVVAATLNLGDYNEYRGWDLPADEIPETEGYVIQYPDGYESWSPKEQFEDAYMTAGDLDYSAALYLLKQGKKLARAGWNGKNMWVSMTPGKTLDMEVDDIWTGNVKDVAIANGGTVEICPYMSLKTADNKIQIGWIPSQSDQLATDWCVVA